MRAENSLCPAPARSGSVEGRLSGAPENWDYQAGSLTELAQLLAKAA